MANKEKRPVYNEPVTRRGGDVVPRLRRVPIARIEAPVRTRLVLERNLRVCGLAKPSRRTPVTAQTHRIVLAMLEETDSPMSASLRARAAVLAGAMGIKAAAPILWRIAADETDDLATRMGAVQSYLRLTARMSQLRRILATKAWQVRACAYAGAMNSDSPDLRAEAVKRFDRERDPRITAYVSRAVPSVLAAKATRPD